MENLQLEKIANEVRKNIVTALHSAGSGHPGGSLSAADMVTYLVHVNPIWSNTFLEENVGSFFSFRFILNCVA